MNGFPINVICVLRSGGDYDAEYVEKLRDGVKLHLPKVHFMCISDCPVPCERVPLKYDWPGWWSKMELFRPDINGDLLYFDLDTMIVGDLKDIAQTRTLTLLSDFGVPKRANSGMMYLPWFSRNEIWEAWIADPIAAMKRMGGHGDGGFIRDIYGDKAARWQDDLPGQIVSYKFDLRGMEVPKGARVVCFHGHPRPRDIKWNLSFPKEQNAAL